MTKLFFQLVTAASVTFMVACNTASDSKSAEGTDTKETASFDMAAAKSAIDAANAKFIDGLKKGDSAAIAALYADDAVVMPPNMDPVSGAGIAGVWGSAIRMGVKDAKFMTDDLSGNADMLAETARYELYDANNKLLDKGKYVVVWKPANGGWKLYRDIWNSSMPAAPAK